MAVLLCSRCRGMAALSWGPLQVDAHERACGVCAQAHKAGEHVRLRLPGDPRCLDPGCGAARDQPSDRGSGARRSAGERMRSNLAAAVLAVDSSVSLPATAQEVACGGALQGDRAASPDLYYIELVASLGITGVAELALEPSPFSPAVTQDGLGHNAKHACRYSWTTEAGPFPS